MTDAPPKGWVSLDGVLKPGAAVGDYAARAQRVIGTCQAEGCKRRLVIDADDLVRAGFERVRMSEVQRLARCARLGGCGLSYHDEEPARRLRLEHCQGRAHVRLRLRCDGNGCRFYRVWTVEEIVQGLARRGAGDERTPVDELHAKLTGQCPVCKKSNWRADVLWLNTDTTGWKQRGEEWFADVAAKRPA